MPSFRSRHSDFKVLSLSSKNPWNKTWAIMHSFHRILQLFILYGTLFVAIATPLTPSVQLRNAPGNTAQDTYLAIKRGLAIAKLEQRQSFSDQITLERSWDGATLLSMSVIQTASSSRARKR